MRHPELNIPVGGFVSSNGPKVADNAIECAPTLMQLVEKLDAQTRRADNLQSVLGGAVNNYTGEEAKVNVAETPAASIYGCMTDILERLTVSNNYMESHISTLVRIVGDGVPLA